MTSERAAERGRGAFSAVVLGTDAVLAAVPATHVQLTHACLAAGYHFAAPASWGDELLAMETVRMVAQRDDRPAVHCACPRVADRLLSVGEDLAPFLVSLVAPPVAAARYIRALGAGRTVHITYVGRCPGATDDSIDARMAPEEFLELLVRRGAAPLDQPEVFDSVIPPDRRRFRSLPGGLPTPELVWGEARERRLVELEGDECLTDLAQQLVANERVLIDLAPALGCACAGAGSGTSAAPRLAVHARGARAAVIALEPPRAASDVVDHDTHIDLLRRPAPAARRREVVVPVGGRVERELVPEPETREERAAIRAVDTSARASREPTPPRAADRQRGSGRERSGLPTRTEQASNGLPRPARTARGQMAATDRPSDRSAPPRSGAASASLPDAAQEMEVAATTGDRDDVVDAADPPGASASRSGWRSTDADSDGSEALRRRRTPALVRPPGAGLPSTHDEAGRSLPRAYVALRRAGTRPGPAAPASLQPTEGEDLVGALPPDEGANPQVGLAAATESPTPVHAERVGEQRDRGAVTSADAGASAPFTAARAPVGPVSAVGGNTATGGIGIGQVHLAATRTRARVRQQPYLPLLLVLAAFAGGALVGVAAARTVDRPASADATPDGGDHQVVGEGDAAATDTASDVVRPDGAGRASPPQGEATRPAPLRGTAAARPDDVTRATAAGQVGRGAPDRRTTTQQRLPVPAPAPAAQPPRGEPAVPRDTTPRSPAPAEMARALDAEREAIRQELEIRRARIDSIARRVEALRMSPPPRR